MEMIDFNGHKRAVIYCRVSTDEQAEHGYSLPSQAVACQNYAEENGFEVVAIFADDFTGTVPIETRPQGKLAHKMLADGEADLLIVYTIDRLVRPPAEGDEWDMPVLIRGLAKLGREIHTVKAGQLKTDFASLLIAMLEAKSAGEERRNMIERTSRGRSHKARDGRVVGVGKAPYGYRYVKNKTDQTVTLEINKEQAKVVRMIFEWYTVGRDGKLMGATLIAHELIAMGIPTPSEANGYKRKKTTKPGVWGNDAVLWILKSETYKGVWRFGKFIGGGGHGGRRKTEETIAVSVPAIVSEATWNAAQTRRKKNTASLRGKHGRRLYLLTGFAFCQCGHTFVGSAGRYVCAHRSNIRRHYDEAPCKVSSVMAHKLEAVVWDHVRGLITNAEELQERLKEARATAFDAMKPKRDELAIVEEMIVDVEAEAGDIAQALTTAHGARLVVARLQAQAQENEVRYSKLTTRRNALKAEIDKATITDEELATLAQFQADALVGLDNPTVELKRRWLELLQVRVTVRLNHEVEVECMIAKDGVAQVLKLKEVCQSPVC